MEFFEATITALITIVTALGAVVGVWGVVNLLEGYGGENPSAKSQGVKQLAAGGGIIVLAQTVLPELMSLFG
uniref:Maff2 family mobile element protein n=1 Tax=Agathobacter sp. TaxID=2021311 RepID=UPI00405674FF